MDLINQLFAFSIPYPRTVIDWTNHGRFDFLVLMCKHSSGTDVAKPFFHYPFYKIVFLIQLTSDDPFIKYLGGLT